MKCTLALFLSVTFVGLPASSQAEVFTDNFDDGNADGWVTYDPIGTILTGVSGTPTTFSEITFPNGGVRFAAPVTPNEAFGISRGGIEYQGFESTDFEISVDVVDLAVLPNNVAAVSARTRDLGPGTTDGYVFAMGTRDTPEVGYFSVSRLDDEVPTIIDREVFELSPTADYRLLFTGVGNTLAGQLFNSTDSMLVGTVSMEDDTYSSGFAGIFTSGNVAPEGPIFDSRGDATFDDYSLTGSVVPEPSTLGMFVLGMVWVVGYRRRVRRLPA